jgi:CheY-like chemotaxis protein
MNKRRVMIVDDDRQFLEELEEMLIFSGYEIVAFNDAQAALESAVRLRPDVILLDVKMPGKSGFQLADELQRLPELEGTPVIAMSGHYKEP